MWGYGNSGLCVLFLDVCHMIILFPEYVYKYFHSILGSKSRQGPHLLMEKLRLIEAKNKCQE